MTAPSELPDRVEPEALPYDCGGLGCGFQPCICDTELRERDVRAATEETRFIVVFADVDMADVHFGGHGAEAGARRYFNARRHAWSCSLYKEVARG